jgi:hypothetical protein
MSAAALRGSACRTPPRGFSISNCGRPPPPSQEIWVVPACGFASSSACRSASSAGRFWRCSAHADPSTLSFAFARRSRVSIADLANQPLIVAERRSRPYSHDLTIKLFAEARVQPHIAQYAEKKQTIVNLVAEDLGVAIVPRWTYACGRARLRQGRVAYARCHRRKIQGFPSERSRTIIVDGPPRPLLGNVRPDPRRGRSALRR